MTALELHNLARIHEDLAGEYRNLARLQAAADAIAAEPDKPAKLASVASKIAAVEGKISDALMLIDPALPIA